MSSDILTCDECSFQTHDNAQLTQHKLKSHSMENINQILNSQVLRLMSTDLLLHNYGLEHGSLKEIFSEEGSQKLFYILQVVEVAEDAVSLSDGENIINNCLLSGSTTKINKNCVIQMNIWSLTQFTPESTREGLFKSEYAINVEEFDIVDNGDNVPLLGTPKQIHIAVMLSEEHDLDKIVVNLLEDLALPENEIMEGRRSWQMKMMRILKKTRGKWSCTVCRNKISPNMDAKVVSHAQLHLR